MRKTVARALSVAAMASALFAGSATAASAHHTGWNHPHRVNATTTLEYRTSPAFSPSYRWSTEYRCTQRAGRFGPVGPKTCRNTHIGGGNFGGSVLVRVR